MQKYRKEDKEEFVRQRSKSFGGGNIPTAVKSVVVVPKDATHLQLGKEKSTGR